MGLQKGSTMDSKKVDSKIILKRPLTSVRMKNFKLSIVNKVKKVISFLEDIDIDFIFVFLASFIFINYGILSRVLFSIGLAYIYKIIIKDIKIIKRIK